MYQEILGFADFHRRNDTPEARASEFFALMGAGMKLARYKLNWHGIMELAGELDDRWPGSRKRAGREESPDTTSRE